MSLKKRDRKHLLNIVFENLSEETDKYIKKSQPFAGTLESLEQDKAAQEKVAVLA